MSYRTASKFRKIRQVTTNNSTGDSFAITVPRDIAQNFSGTFFSISTTPNSIIFTSGGKLQ